MITDKFPFYSSKGYSANIRGWTKRRSW